MHDDADRSGITVAYAYSAVVALDRHGKVFFWELATLIGVGGRRRASQW